MFWNKLILVALLILVGNPSRIVVGGIYVADYASKV
jgi:hypothetical protein